MKKKKKINLNLLLNDDPSKFGGIAYSGETLGDFLEFLKSEGYESSKLTRRKVNTALKECGIAKIKRKDFFIRNNMTKKDLQILKEFQELEEFKKEKEKRIEKAKKDREEILKIFNFSEAFVIYFSNGENYFSDSENIIFYDEQSALDFIDKLNNSHIFLSEYEESWPNGSYYYKKVDLRIGGNNRTKEQLQALEEEEFEREEEKRIEKAKKDREEIFKMFNFSEAFVIYFDSGEHYEDHFCDSENIIFYDEQSAKDFADKLNNSHIFLSKYEEFWSNGYYYYKKVDLKTPKTK